MPMTLLPITLTIAGACGLLALWLAARVTQLRMRHNISLGDAGNDALLGRMRAHANFAEYAPLFLILLALLELAHGAVSWLWIAGAVFVLARVAHLLGMDRPAPNALRIAGTMLTWLSLGALSGMALATPYLLKAPGPVMIG